MFSVLVTVKCPNSNSMITALNGAIAWSTIDYEHDRIRGYYHHLNWCSISGAPQPGGGNLYCIMRARPRHGYAAGVAYATSSMSSKSHQQLECSCLNNILIGG